MAAIHEHVLLPRVAMEVTVHHEASFVVQIFYQLFGIEHRWMQAFMRLLPAPVQIAAGEGASVVAINHTVGVEHRNDLEDVVLPQKPRLFAFGICQEAKYAAHHPGADDFSWMHPRRYHDCLLLLHLVNISFLRDREQFAIHASEGFTERLPRADGSAGRFGLDLVEVLHEITVGIRIAIRKVYDIVIMLERVREGQSVVSPARVADVLLDCVAIVRDLLATAKPSLPLKLTVSSADATRHRLRVYADLHAKIEQRIDFGEVHDVELDGQVLPRVLDLEEEPLRMPIRIDVVLHQEVVLVVAHLLRQIEVA